MNQGDAELERLFTLLQRLRIEEGLVIQRIKDCTRHQQQINNETNESREEETDENSEAELQIGDNVRILNPRRFQEDTGIITKISETRVTITPRRGIKIVRDPKNVRKID
jgi:hypothetical protein